MTSRLASLDAFRGFAVAGMVLVNNPGDWGHLHPPLAHAAWNGWTFTDLVFPFFLFAVGVSMALSIERRRAAGDSGALLRTTARRAAVLFAIGLALNLFPAFDLATLRIPGVLQRIALCIIIAAPLAVHGTNRTVAIGIAALMLAYTLPMLYVPVSGADGVTAAGRLAPGRDFGAWVDRLLLAGHLWAQTRTWDPEGLVSTLPAACSVLLGALAGRVFSGKAGAPVIPAFAATTGFALLGAGLVLDAVLMPINKNLWTPSYCVFMTGFSLVVFAAFHALMDASPSARLRAAARAVLSPFTILGMNALFIFVLSGIVARLVAAIHVSDAGISLKAWLYAPIRALPLSAENASLAFALAFELAMLAVAWMMWRKQWFVKV